MNLCMALVAYGIIYESITTKVICNKELKIVGKRTILLLTLFLFTAAMICFASCNVQEDSGKQDNDIGQIKEIKIEYLDGWVNVESLNVRKEPSEQSEIVGYLLFNDKVRYRACNENWLVIEYDGNEAYVYSEYISNEDMGYDSYEQYSLDEIYGYKEYDAPGNSGFKSFMDYRTITLIDSPQYELQESFATTGNYGIRMVDGRYCVAVGSHFTSDIGQYFDLILDNGTVIPCVLADQKDDAHTDGSNIITMHNGCMSEFIVDMYSLNESVRYNGNISLCTDKWNSSVVGVKIYNKNVFDE